MRVVPNYYVWAKEIGAEITSRPLSLDEPTNYRVLYLRNFLPVSLLHENYVLTFDRETVNFVWKQASELKIGDWISTQVGRFKGLGSITAAGKVLGIYAGIGRVHGLDLVSLLVSKHIGKKQLAEILKTVKVYDTECKIKFYQISDKLTRVLIRSKKINALVRLRSSFFGWDEGFRSANTLGFIKGILLTSYISADKSDRYFVISQKNNKLSRLLANLLMAFGIIVRFYKGQITINMARGAHLLDRLGIELPKRLNMNDYVMEAAIPIRAIGRIRFIPKDRFVRLFEDILNEEERDFIRRVAFYKIDYLVDYDGLETVKEVEADEVYLNGIMVRCEPKNCFPRW